LEDVSFYEMNLAAAGIGGRKSVALAIGAGTLPGRVRGGRDRADMTPDVSVSVE